MKTTISEVLVIGGGPSGLTAATALRKQTGADVTILEREIEAGGIPRHSDHLGYGMRDMRAFISGPTYAKRLVDRALDAGVKIHPQTMVTSWADTGVAEVTSPDGRAQVKANVVLLATGARERPRPARMIPGGRPAGVYTTGELQNAVHGHHQQVGSRAVVVGGELVSWSAVMTLREANCQTAAMVTQYPRAESYRLFNAGGRVVFRTPVRVMSKVVQVLGRTRVTGVEIEDLRTEQRNVIECDTVVFTGDWIPDHELARSAGITLNSGTRGPLVDAAGRTSHRGIFAAGNLVHPVDTADVAALGGGHTATAIAAFLAAPESYKWPAGIAITGDYPIRWVSPGSYQPGVIPSRNRLLAWVDREIPLPIVTAHQDGVLVGRKRLPWPASPGRVFRVPWSLLKRANPGGGPISIGFSA